MEHFQLKRPASESVIDMAKIGGRDPNLDLFHAMGKVLYCKREDSFEAHKLPGILILQNVAVSTVVLKVSLKLDCQIESAYSEMLHERAVNQ